MWTTLRNRLRLIRYYSAPRRRTAWTWAADVALVLSMLLAVPAAMVSDVVVVRGGRTDLVTGHLHRLDDGSIVARQSVARLGARRSGGEFIGEYQMLYSERERGWPLTTTLAVEPPSLTLFMDADARPRRGVQLAPGDAIRSAIETELEAVGSEEMLAALRGELKPARLPLAWVFAAGMWWVMLTMVLLAVANTAALAGRARAHRRAVRGAVRHAEGLCPECGYDLRGSDFSERCPECGARV